MAQSLSHGLMCHLFQFRTQFQHRNVLTFVIIYIYEFNMDIMTLKLCVCNDVLKYYSVKMYHIISFCVKLNYSKMCYRIFSCRSFVAEMSIFVRKLHRSKSSITWCYNLIILY